MITFTSKIEVSECKKAAWLHMKPRKIFAIAGIMILALAVFAICISINQVITTGKGWSTVLTVGGGLVYFTILFFVVMPRRIARAYAQQKLLHEVYTVEISDTHLVTKTATANSTISWETFHKWKSNKNMVLLYQSDTVYHVFSKQAFQSLEDFESFKKILTAKLGKASG